MSSTSESGVASATPFYRAAWRWHFYAGLAIVPVFLLLAVTGLIMMYASAVEKRAGGSFTVQGAPLSIETQARAAEAAVPDGKVSLYIAPRAPANAAVFIVNSGDVPHTVTVDPTSAKVLDTYEKNGTWYAFADSLHSDLLLGTAGDRIIETAASLGFILLASGVYLWWPRGTQGLRLVPRFSLRGRSLWKDLHTVSGIYVGVVMFFFLISGLSWAGVWGGKLVQAWSTFPAEKWDNVPLSDKTHAAMNHGAIKEVPWALEQTPMPASGSAAGVTGIPEGQAVTLDSVAALARQIGFDGQFRINVPKGETGVYTVSADSMDGDTTTPTGDRTVHVDRYTGKILAQVGFADYSIWGKAMAVGIPLHMGEMGLWNLVLNTAFCAFIIFLCLSGVVMWWMRRPAGAFRLAPPPVPAHLPHWRGAMLVMLLVSLAFPMAGVTLIAVLLLDTLIVSRVPALTLAFK